jgi:BatD DUF11 like domain
VRPAPLSLAVLAVLAVLPGARPASADEVDVRVRLEPEVIGVDETATFSIEVHGEGFTSLLFRPSFELDNLEVVDGPSQREDMRLANRTLSRTLRLSWEVRPLGIGKARVYDILLQMNGSSVQLQPREIRVRREPTQQAQRSYGADDEDDPFQQFFGRMPQFRRRPEEPEVFLRSEVQPRQPVVGQQMLYSLYLYTREDIAALSTSGVPAFRGFWVQDIPIPQQIPTEMVEIDGRRFGRVPLLRKALFPLRPGRYRVEPATVDLTVQRYDREFFFGRPIARSEPLRLQTGEQWVSVQPLPPAPPGFGGAVGQLALSAELQPREVRLGEAATLTVRLAGTGNLQGVPEPEVEMPAGVTVHPPQQEGKEEVAAGQIKGSRTWKYAVVPERAGRYTLETPEITYFDPATRQYRVATSPDLRLAALPAAQGGGDVSDFRAGGLHSIRTAASSKALAGRRWPGGLLPWLFLLPWGLALVVTLARRHTRNGARNGGPPASPVSLGHGGFEEKLREAEAEERPRHAAIRIEEAWREVLAGRWSVPPATPPARWREALAGKKLPAEVLDELGRLIEDLQYLRHAPQLSATGSLRAEVLARSRRLLRRMS